MKIHRDSLYLDLSLGRRHWTPNKHRHWMNKFSMTSRACIFIVLAHILISLACLWLATPS